MYNKSQYHRERRINTTIWINTFRTKCIKCGESDPIVLDFHHRDKKQKKFQLIGSNCYSRSKASILTEINKCDVLCANCHRREEYKLRNMGSSAVVSIVAP